MTHNVEFNPDTGKAARLTIVDSFGDTVIFDRCGDDGPTSGFLPRVEMRGTHLSEPLVAVNESSGDSEALRLFLARECDFSEPRWSLHDIVRWYNGSRWSTFVRTSEDFWLQFGDDGRQLPRWHDESISRLVDGKMFGEDSDNEVEVARQALA